MLINDINVLSFSTLLSKRDETKTKKVVNAWNLTTVYIYLLFWF